MKLKMYFFPSYFKLTMNQKATSISYKEKSVFLLWDLFVNIFIYFLDRISTYSFRSMIIVFVNAFIINL